MRWRAESARAGRCLLAVLAAGGCHRAIPLDDGVDASDSPGLPIDGRTLEAPLAPADASSPLAPDAPADGPVDAPVDACTRRACIQPGGRYCGIIPDHCGGQVDCGGCPDGWTCGVGPRAHLCVSADPQCQPLTCQLGCFSACGRIGDGCGGVLDCPTTCPGGGETCGTGVWPRVCWFRPGLPCKPSTCQEAGGARYCGKIGDSCCGTLDCGSCPAGGTCVDHVCQPRDCLAVRCDEGDGRRYCGTIGDGCGRTLACGPCPAGQTCGGSGIPGVCPGSPPDTRPPPLPIAPPQPAPPDLPPPPPPPDPVITELP